MSWEEDVLDFSELERQMADFVDRSVVADNLKTQLAELEMLQSIFPNPKEFVLDDRFVIDDIQDFCNGKGATPPMQLDFIINLVIDDKKFEVSVNLPYEYPTEEPGIFVRNDQLGRAQQHSLNMDLAKFISSLPRDEVCIYSGITWLQENALSYFESKPAPEEKKPRLKEAWARLWVYSHHIYSKSKRKELQDLAQEYEVTGFCLPGRPGIICLEGIEADCEDCWFKIKTMNWKKILCIKKEKGQVKSGCFRRFENFSEVSFEAGKVRAKEFHMDFGEFYRFLCNHGSEYMFKEFFGVDGKVSQ